MDCEILVKTISSPYGLIGLCVILAIIIKIVFKVDYMNCWEIIKNHFSIFKKEEDKTKYVLIPFFTYAIFPVILAISINHVKVINGEIINIITIIVSILTSMLFTLLVMLIDMKGKNNLLIDSSMKIVVAITVKETYYTVMFEILLAILILILSLTYMVLSAINAYISAVIYSLVLLLLFNLFIVLKRIFKLIESYFNQKVSEK